MSVITPSDTALAYLAELSIGQQRFDMSEQSDSSGHTATRLGGPPRWIASLRTLDALEPAVGAMWKSIAMQMRGRVNHLAIYDVTQPQPRGTARGSMVLASSAAAGATSISLSGLRGTNILLGGSFEVDTNADGMADGWSSYSSGTTGVVSHVRSLTLPVVGSWSQRSSATGLGSSISDKVGVLQSSVPVTGGTVYTLGAQMRIATGTGLRGLLAVDWFDGGGGFISGAFSDVALTGSMAAYSVTGTAPSNAVTATVYLVAHSLPAGPGAAAIDIDAAQFVAAGSVGAYPATASLLQGDMLLLGAGVGSHYCMVTGDAGASEEGAITINIEPATRKAISSGTAVTWDKPRGHFKLRPDSQSWSGVAGGSGVGGFALDLIEDWSA